MIRAARLLNVRRMRRQPLRVVLAVVAVAAGVALAMVPFVVAGSMSKSFATIGRSLAGPAPLRIVGATSRGGLDERVLDTVDRTPGVAAAVPVVQAVTFGHTSPTSKEDVGVLALGVDCRIEAFVGPFGCDPNALAATPDSVQPLVAPSLARRLGPHGEIRTDLGSVPVAGAPTPDRLDAIGAGHIAVFPLPVAQRLFARPHALDVIYVKPAPGVDVGALRARLAHAVGSWNGVLRSTDPPLGGSLALGAFLPIFGMLSTFAVAIAAVLVYDTVSLSVEERRRDLAIVGALGGRSRTIVGGTMIETGLLGFVGGLLGGAGALVLAQPITASMSSFTTKWVGMPVTVHATPVPFVLGVVLGTVLAAVAAWLPARRVTRMDVAAELSNRQMRDETAAPVRTKRAIVYTSLACTALVVCWLAQRNGALAPWQPVAGQAAVGLAAAFFIIACGAWAPVVLRGVGRVLRRPAAATRLGLANLVRDPGRTATMAAAVGAPIATAFIIVSFVTSIHDGVTQGITKGYTGLVRVSTVDPNNSANLESKMSPQAMSQLRALPGVARVDRTAYVLTGHEVGKLVAVKAIEHPDPQWRLPLITGTADLGRLERGEVMVGPSIARRMHLRAGSTLRLDTPKGWTPVHVQGVWQDGDSNGQAVTMSMPLLESLYGSQPSTELLLKPAPGVSPAVLAAEARGAGIDARLQSQTAPQLATRISHEINAQFASFWALQRGLLLVAFVAVLSTLLLVAVQRRRELALLAAVGMAPGELGRMVVVEGLAVGLVGTVLVFGAGTGTYFALQQVVPIVIGFKDPFRLALPTIPYWGAVATVVVVAAASLPAWRTAHVEVVENLQYE
jgi:putative ABC transport system permease protein